tara:strand:- start:441 stop:677 length:237 start_codon:yes stop_codon:yes gene_type:complete
MALTKADMTEQLYEELGFNKREAKELVEMFFEEVRAALEAGENVKLSGFGNLSYAIKVSDLGETQKQVRKSLLQLDVS